MAEPVWDSAAEDILKRIVAELEKRCERKQQAILDLKALRASDTAESGIEASDASAEQQRIRRLRRNIEECEAELQSVGTIGSDTGIDPPVDLCLCGRLGSIVLLEETKLAVDQLCQTIDKLQLNLSTMTADVSEHRNFVEQQQRIHQALQASVQAHEPEISASARGCHWRRTHSMRRSSVSWTNEGGPQSAPWWRCWTRRRCNAGSSLLQYLASWR